MFPVYEIESVSNSWAVVVVADMACEHTAMAYRCNQRDVPHSWAVVAVVGMTNEHTAMACRGNQRDGPHSGKSNSTSTKKCEAKYECLPL